jgi:hypothetical protein
MTCELNGSETVLTGLAEDQSAVVPRPCAIDAPGIERGELRRIRPGPPRPELGDDAAT